MQCNVPKMHRQKYYANTMLINTGVAPHVNKKQFSLTIFFPDNSDVWSIPQVFPNSFQIPWHFQVLPEKWSPRRTWVQDLHQFNVGKCALVL